VCEETVSSGPVRKGDVTWPDTAVGRRVSVRCPYAYTRPVFVTRDCILATDVDNSSAAASWTPWSWDDMDVCPDPPFTRRVQRLYRRLVILHVQFFVVADVRFETIALVARFCEKCVIVGTIMRFIF